MTTLKLWLRVAAALLFVAALLAAPRLIAAPCGDISMGGPMALGLEIVTLPRLLLTLVLALLFAWASPLTSRDIGVIFLGTSAIAFAAVVKLHSEAPPLNSSVPEGIMRPDALTFSIAYSLCWLLASIGTMFVTSQLEGPKPWPRRLAEVLLTLIIWVTIVALGHLNLREVYTKESYAPMVLPWCVGGATLTVALAYAAGLRVRRSIVLFTLIVVGATTLAVINHLEYTALQRWLYS